MCLREGAPFDSSFVLSTSRGENDQECDEVFSRWESGPLKNHTFEDVLIASKYGNQLFSSMSLGDVVLYLVLNESSDGERADLPMAVNSIAL